MIFNLTQGFKKKIPTPTNQGKLLQRSNAHNIVQKVKVEFARDLRSNLVV